MSAQQPKHATVVAVPYYGSLSLPPLGLSRLFFLAEVDRTSRKVRRVEMQVWDPHKEPNLSVWLRQQGISGVICSDSGSHYRAALAAQHIWLVGRQEGEAVEVVERWAAAAAAESSRPHGPEAGSWRLAPPEAAAIAA